MTMPPILTFATAGSYEIGRHQPTHYALGTKVAVNVAGRKGTTKPMPERFTREHVDTWRREGGVLIERFFTPAEVAAVRADFEEVFGRSRGADRNASRTSGNASSAPRTGFREVNIIARR